jgi:hypothetical protein
MYSVYTTGGSGIMAKEKTSSNKLLPTSRSNANIYGMPTADVFELVFRRRFLGRDSALREAPVVAIGLAVFGWRGGRIVVDDLFDCFFLHERGLGPRALDGGRLLIVAPMLPTSTGIVVDERFAFSSCRTSCTSSCSFSATTSLTLALPVFLLLPVALAETAGPLNVELWAHLVRS